MSKLIAIDADILVYQIAFSVEKHIYCCNNKEYKLKKFAENESAASGCAIFKRKKYLKEDQIYINLNAKLNMIYEDLGTDNHELFITSSQGPDNFRNALATLLPYKANRLKTPRPHYYQRIREILLDEYQATPITGEEADDALGKVATYMYNKYGDYEHLYIASIDKDLKMIPGYHYHLNTRNLTYVTEEEGLYNFYLQLIKGDATDNIPGLYKLLLLNERTQEAKGLIKQKYLQQIQQQLQQTSPDQYYTVILQWYTQYGFGEKEVNEIAQLLWIRRDQSNRWGYIV